LELGLIVREVVQRLQHQHLEHQGHVVRLAPGVALALLVVNHFQQGAERLPVDDAVQPTQRVTQLLQSCQPIFLVEKAWLHLIRPLRAHSLLFCPNWGIFRGALKFVPR